MRVGRIEGYSEVLAERSQPIVVRQRQVRVFVEMPVRALECTEDSIRSRDEDAEPLEPSLEKWPIEFTVVAGELSHEKSAQIATVHFDRHVAAEELRE